MRKPVRRVSSFRPSVESAESRILLSTVDLPLVVVPRVVVPHAHRHPHPRPQPAAIKTDPVGVSAILSALKGGAGSEFVKLVRSEAPNLGSVIRGFVSGKLTQYNVNGFAVKIPNIQSQYSGPIYDHLSATAAGALSLKNHQLELAGILRGPFHAEPGYVVFGLDRGAGASVGPRFASVPGITPDMIVTIKVDPYGASASGTITDLTTNAVTTIDPSQIKVAGAAVRVFLNADQVPSKGLPTANYKFDMWTQHTLGGIDTVGSFAPGSSMIQVGRQR